MQVALHTRLKAGAEVAYGVAHQEVQPVLLDVPHVYSGARAAQTLPVGWRL